MSNVRVCLYRELVMAEANGKEPIYEHNLLKPYVFFDVSAGRETRQGTGSLRNQVSLAPESPINNASDKFCMLLIAEQRQFFLSHQTGCLQGRGRVKGGAKSGIKDGVKDEVKLECLRSSVGHRSRVVHWCLQQHMDLVHHRSCISCVSVFASQDRPLTSHSHNQFCPLCWATVLKQKQT